MKKTMVAMVFVLLIMALAACGNSNKRNRGVSAVAFPETASITSNAKQLVVDWDPLRSQNYWLPQGVESSVLSFVVRNPNDAAIELSAISVVISATNGTVGETSIWSGPLKLGRQALGSSPGSNWSAFLAIDLRTPNGDPVVIPSKGFLGLEVKLDTSKLYQGMKWPYQEQPKLQITLIGINPVSFVRGLPLKGHSLGF